MFPKVVTQLLRAEVRNEIDPAAGLCSSLDKKKKEANLTLMLQGSIRLHSLLGSTSCTSCFIWKPSCPWCYLISVRPQGWGAHGGHFWEKKNTWSVSQSVRPTDRQTECTLFPPGDWGQAESPCSRHSNSPGSLSRFGKTTADWCQTTGPTKQSCQEFGFTITASPHHQPAVGHHGSSLHRLPPIQLFQTIKDVFTLGTKGLWTCPSKISPPSLPSRTSTLAGARGPSA